MISPGQGGGPARPRHKISTTRASVRRLYWCQRSSRFGVPAWPFTFDDLLRITRRGARPTAACHLAILHPIVAVKTRDSTNPGGFSEFRSGRQLPATAGLDPAEDPRRPARRPFSVPWSAPAVRSGGAWMARWRPAPQTVVVLSGARNRLWKNGPEGGTFNPGRGKVAPPAQQRLRRPSDQQHGQPRRSTDPALVRPAFRQPQRVCWRGPSQAEKGILPRHGARSKRKNRANSMRWSA